MRLPCTLLVEHTLGPWILFWDVEHLWHGDRNQSMLIASLWFVTTTDNNSSLTLVWTFWNFLGITINNHGLEPHITIGLAIDDFLAVYSEELDVGKLRPWWRSWDFWCSSARGWMPKLAKKGVRPPNGTRARLSVYYVCIKQYQTYNWRSILINPRI